MEQLVDLGEQAIFILMAIASVMAVAVGFERAFVFSRSVSKSESILKEIISKLRIYPRSSNNKMFFPNCLNCLFTL
jgi:hypothetical protein